MIIALELALIARPTVALSVLKMELVEDAEPRSSLYIKSASKIMVKANGYSANST